MVTAHDIAALLGASLIGSDLEIKRVVGISQAQAGDCVFAKKYTDKYCKMLQRTDILALVTPEYEDKILCPHIVCSNARLAVIYVLRAFFAPPAPHSIHPTAIIGPQVKLGQNVGIGAYSVLDGDITVGDNTLIANHVSITGPVTIGPDCWIKSGAVIGEEGFGFERDENDMFIHFPHIGRIEIGRGVFIGANSTVERAALETTVIEDGAIVDDLTQVGHNVHIGKGSSLACGAVLCGGVRLGARCSVAPNACVRQQLTVGDDVVIGLGAVVVKDLPGNAVYIGNPARPLVKKEDKK